METLVFGNLAQEGLEVVSRNGSYFVRYDAGSHCIAWREDEISVQEFDLIKSGKQGEYQAILNMQRRLESSGVNPYQRNWSPTNA